jgi:hypothetical protein
MLQNIVQMSRSNANINHLQVKLRFDDPTSRAEFKKIVYPGIDPKFVKMDKSKKTVDFRINIGYVHHPSDYSRVMTTMKAQYEQGLKKLGKRHGFKVMSVVPKKGKPLLKKKKAQPRASADEHWGRKKRGVDGKMWKSEKGKWKLVKSVKK